MIQRIQTVFLFLVVITLGIFLWMPLIHLEATNFSDSIPGWDIRHFYNGYIFFVNAILTGIAAGFALLGIFLFKKRNLQIVFCCFSLLFIALAEAVVYYAYQTKVFVGDVVFTWWNLLALVAAVLLFLAIRAIRKDENLVKSLNRLR